MPIIESYPRLPSGTSRLTAPSAAECDRIKDEELTIGDIVGGNPIFDTFILQLYVHTIINSKLAGGVHVNDYEGLVHLGQGIYPDRTDHPMFNHDGSLAVDPEFGLLPVHKNGKIVFLTGDIHRSVENRLLSATHWLAHKVHNARLPVNRGDIEETKFDVMALLTRLFCNAAERSLGIDEQALLEFASQNRTNTVNTHEVIFGASRWLHATVPDEIGGLGVFDNSRNPLEIRFSEWLQIPGPPLGTTLAPAMTKMLNVKNQPDIRDMTLDRTVNQDIGLWGDLAVAVGHPLPNDDPDRFLPVWVGLLKEAENNSHRPGPIGLVVLARMFADSFKAPRGQGLWRPLWDDLAKTEDILEWVDSLDGS